MRKYFGFVVPLLMVAVLFTSAGRLNLPFFWAVVLAPLPIFLFVSRRIDPELMNERLVPAPGGCDRNLRYFGIPLFVIQFVIAGFDVGRYHWSAPISAPIRILGLIGYLLGLCIASWAVLTNQFFSPVVRLQTERGHHVVTTGLIRTSAIRATRAACCAGSARPLRSVPGGRWHRSWSCWCW